VVLLLLELVAFVLSEQILKYSETMAFNDQIVYAKSSPYQRIVLTRNKRELRLFLNGNLQFSSADEYRYHEALVHPAVSSIKEPKQILVLGGGDGLAVRELLKYPSIEKITLVDLDPEMTRLFRSQSVLLKLNQQSLLNKKVTVINSDAFIWLRKNQQQFDAVIIDFPDPSAFSIGKLYSTLFYTTLKSAVKENGIVVIQSTSPYVAPKSFWCIDETLRSVGFFTKPYHNYVPSFGEWGYIIATLNQPTRWFQALPEGLKYIDSITVQQLFIFPEDMRTKEKLQPNQLNNQALVHYFEEEWSKYLD
jgi:spermidine synthase